MSNSTKLNTEDKEDKSVVLSDIKEKIFKMKTVCDMDSFFLGGLPVSLPMQRSSGRSLHGKIAEIYCDENGILRGDLVLSADNKDSEIFLACNIEQLSIFDLNYIARVLSINLFSFS